ncbi:hypothetical protein L208DRAFT_1282291, partial [Tricholoma matsutake]
VHRVNWLHAHALFECASEEKVIVHHEMSWTVRYFKYQTERWRNFKNAGRTTGHVVYAVGQEGMWCWFWSSAIESFSQVGIHCT